MVLTDLVMTTEQSGMNMLLEARKVDPYIMAILFTAKRGVSTDMRPLNTEPLT